MSQATPTKAVPVPDRPRSHPFLSAKGIHRSFQMGDSTVAVLKGVDFALRDGEFVAIEGRSGSGKSTLLHILASLDGIDAGSVTYDGNDYTTFSEQPGRYGELFRPRSVYHWFRAVMSISGRWAIVGFCVLLASSPLGLLYVLAQVLTKAVAPAATDKLSGLLAAISWALRISATSLSVFAVLALAVGLPVWLLSAGVFAILNDRRERPKSKLRNREFGFVFQFYHLLPELNVLENTLLAPMIREGWLSYRRDKVARRQRAIELLEQMGLGHRLKHRPNQLSGGERQRVAIARALMNNPRVLFADEPTGNLDYDTGRQIMNLLEKLHRDHNQTIVMVTHDRALAREADRVLVLKDGRLEKAE